MTNGGTDSITRAVELTVPSRIEPGRRAANTPNVQPIEMPRKTPMPDSRKELASASWRFGHTSRLPLMLFGQSPVRNPPSHWK